MRRRAVLVVMLVLVGVATLAACSDDDDKDADVPPTTTTLAPTSSTTVRRASTTTTPRNTPSSSLPTPTTRAANGSSSVKLTGPRGPSSPVECNAETTDVELRWTAAGATKIELSIDGEAFATYGNGTKTELVPLECDGQQHEYRVTASAGGSTSSSSLTLRSA